MAILLTITHDPAGQQATYLDNELFLLFDKSFVIATPDTHSLLLTQLCRFTNVAIRLPLGMAQARRDVLRLASQETGHFFYCDLDRLIYWYNHHKEELENVINHHAASADFVVFGRTLEAFDSHPQWQRDTERVMNQVVFMSDIFENGDREFDFFAGARGISDEIVKYVSSNSKEDWAAQDVEWTYLAKWAGSEVEYYEVNGLAYESEYLNIKRSDEKEINLRIKNLTSVVDYVDRCR